MKLGPGYAQNVHEPYLAELRCCSTVVSNLQDTHLKSKFVM